MLDETQLSKFFRGVKIARKAQLDRLNLIYYHMLWRQQDV